MRSMLGCTCLVVVVFAAAVASATCGPAQRSNGSSTFLGPDERAMLFASFNDILGSKQNMSFADASVSETISRMHVGGLRHPGGTVANYWSVANATFVDPCSMQGLYDFCSSKEALAAYPAQTFSPANFASIVAPQLQPSEGGLRVVFDLNLLTLTEAEAIAQVDVLASSIPNASARVRFIELGNEYYLDKHYSHWFPNATTYMQKATRVIARVRQLLPNAEIAAVTSRSNNNWNSQVAAFAHLIDAVTIHDYSGYIARDERGDDTAWEALVLHGPAVVHDYAANVRRLFGADKRIWMTEFNTMESVTKEIAFTVGHMIFVLNYLFAGACESAGTVQVMMMHMLWGQVDNWGLDDGPVLLPLTSDTPDDAKYNAMAQLFSRLGEHSSNDRMSAECLDFSESAGCPTGTARGGTQVRCLRGVRFAHPDGSAHSVITQGCAQNVTVDIAVPAGSKAYVHKYFHWQTGVPTEFKYCAKDKPLYACGVQPHEQQEITGDASGVARLSLPHLTVTFIDVYPR